MTLDETLTARDVINEALRETLDTATDKWGVKVVRVEVQKIDPPQDIADAMSKQMKAEREKRATILEAEAYREKQILEAEGDKQNAILKAEGDREAEILRADGEAKAIEKVSKEILDKIIRFGSQADSAPNGRSEHITASKDKECATAIPNKAGFVFNIIDTINKKTTNTVSVEDSKFLIQRLEQLSKDAMET